MHEPKASAFSTRDRQLDCPSALKPVMHCKLVSKLLTDRKQLLIFEKCALSR